MKVRTPLIAMSAAVALLAPAGYGATAKHAPRHKTAIVVKHVSKPKRKVKPATVGVARATIPSTTITLPETSPPVNDPNAVDCTYMVCSSAADPSAGSGDTPDTTATAAATQSTSADSSGDVESQFCIDEPYMC
jgi:hypothetical protein